jgi:AAA family ATP:ADP antiporter
MTSRARAAITPVLAATIAAAAMVAQHVTGKATRDALFLSHYDVARLPLAITAGSLFSAALVGVLARLVARYGPARTAPRLFAMHAGALVVEWALAMRFERVAAVVVYLHTAALGAAILSVFWSVVSESFDPHAARSAVGRIGAGATLGGVAGGALAFVASKAASVPSALLVMAALSALGAWGVGALARQAKSARADAQAPASGFAALRDTPYLRHLALLVLTSAMLQSLLEYALGARAVAAYGSGASLLAFFAVFQGAIGVLSFIVQSTANRPALERLGIGGTVALLPASVAALGAAALGAPSLLMIALQRGADGALRASLFRSTYEVLFTPVPQALKRATKTIIDVSFDRFGLLLGSGVTLVILALAPSSAVRVATAATIAVCAAQLALAYVLHRGYVATLAERLRTGAIHLDPRDIVDATTRNTLSRTLSDVDRKALLATIEAYRAADPIARAAELLDDLARDQTARDAMRALSALAPRVTGTLVDALLDESRPPRARRRVARVLRSAAGERAKGGLVAGLDAEAFEVRHACARALVELRAKGATLALDADAMLVRARRALASDEDPHGLEHAFDLLALAAPSEAIELAYGALHCDDAYLHGVALEYLDVVLPADVRAALAPHLPSSSPRSVPRPDAKPIDDLLRSKAKIEITLEELRFSRDPDA